MVEKRLEVLIQTILKNLSSIFMISFLIVSLVVALIFGGYSSYTYNKILIEEVYDDIEHVAEDSAKQVNLFLEGKKARTVDFSSDGFIKNSLKELKTNPSEFVSEAMLELSAHLINNKIVVDESFYEVSVLDVNGEVVGTTNPEEPFGTGFSEDLVFTEGKKAPYVKESFYDDEFKRNGIALSAPVLREGEFVGVIVIKISLEQLTEIVVRAGNFEEYGQVYLIDNDILMITPSKFLKGEKAGISVQEVDTENSKDCFDESIISHAERDEPVISFLDYRGEEVFGTHREIIEANWCLMAEINKSEALDAPLRDYIMRQVIIGLIVVMLFSLVGFFVGRYFDEKYISKKEIK